MTFRYLGKIYQEESSNIPGETIKESDFYGQPDSTYKEGSNENKEITHKIMQKNKEKS